MNEPVADTFPPFPRESVASHWFAPDAERTRRAAQFLATVDRYCALKAERGSLAGIPVSDAAYARQLEKDEEFWAHFALMTLFESGDRIENLATLLRKGLGDKPPVPELRAWDQVLLGELALYFDVDMPAPREYREHLRAHVADHHFFPFVPEAGRGGRRQLDVAPRIDALLINTTNGFAVCMMARMAADIACRTPFDARRNDIARAIDLLLERADDDAPLFGRRDVDRTFFLLLTPRMFREEPRLRLYGGQWYDYKVEPRHLAEDLHHRSLVNWKQVAMRLGWAAWEECAEIVPDSCPWLRRARHLK